MIRTLGLLLLLAGCATGTLDCSAGPGSCKAGFQRFLTDTSVTLNTAEGGSFTYSSSPNAAASAEAFAAINRLAGLLAAGRLPPRPLVPSEQDDAADGHLEDSSWRRSCPAVPSERLTPVNYRFEAVEL